MQRAVVLSLHGFATGVADELVTERTAGPEELLLQRERIGYLHDAIEVLPDRLRHVVRGYFLQERGMAELAAELGVTESRVSQLRAEAVSLLKDGMNAQLEPAAGQRAGAGQLRGAAAGRLLRPGGRSGQPAQPARGHQPPGHAAGPGRLRTPRRRRISRPGRGRPARTGHPG